MVVIEIGILITGFIVGNIVGYFIHKKKEDCLSSELNDLYTNKVYKDGRLIIDWKDRSENISLSSEDGVL